MKPDGLWMQYTALLRSRGEAAPADYQAWYFCDNREAADALAGLVMAGTKRATASLHMVFDSEGEKLPAEGDCSVITTFDGEAVCIIRTTGIEIIPFKDVPEEFAATEGEGDKSLAHWRRCHREFFGRELERIGKVWDEGLLVVCERFEKVYP
jgi:uncharacterized protein YhfF